MRWMGCKGMGMSSEARGNGEKMVWKGGVAGLVSAGLLISWPGIPTAIALVVVDGRPGKAQTTEAVARIAEAITVRIEGATQGSGVIVQRHGNRYFVLTAWHVVSGQRPGEELDIYTADGQRHLMEQGSIQRVGKVDMAVLIFSSANTYRVATFGETKSLAIASPVFVSGYPLPNETISTRSFVFVGGELVANGAAHAARSQHLLYRNPTLPGMSGGPVFNGRGQLVGIHINAVSADQINENTGKPVAIQVNQGLAVDSFRQLPVSTTAQDAAPEFPAQAQLATSSQPTAPTQSTIPESSIRRATTVNTVALWGSGRRPVGLPLQGHAWGVNSVSFSPDGRHIISGSHDSTLRLWDASTGKPVGLPFQGHTDFVYSVAFSPDGRRVVSGSADYTLRIWDADSGRPIGSPLRGHTGRVNSVAFSPDGHLIISGADDKTLRIWDADSGRPIGTPLRGHSSHVTSVAFSPDGRLIVSGSRDGTLRLWNASSGRGIGSSLQGFTDRINVVTFSPDGRYIVSGSADKTLRLWDASSGKQVSSPMSGHQGEVISLAFSPDGRIIVSGSADRTVRLWDANSGQPIGQPIPGHSGTVNSVAFSPDGRRIVSGANDQTLRIWEPASATP